MTTIPDLRPWLDALQALSFVKSVELRPADAIRLTTSHGHHDYRVAVKTSHPLGYAALEPFLRAPVQGRRLLLARYIPTPMAQHLRAAGIDYMDLAGNCSINLDDRYLAQVEGRKLPLDAAKPATARTAGFQLLLALVARPDILDLPVREIARLAGTGKSATAQTIARLTEEGLFADTAAGRRILRPAQLLERLSSAYPATRRRWLQGRYRTADTTVESLEARIADAMGTRTWAWGGAAAAMRLTHHFRGDETVVHLDAPDLELPRRLRAVPDRTGPLTLLVAPTPLAFEGPLPHAAHPLLVYLELVSSADERARDTATRLRERFLTVYPPVSG